MIFVLSLIAKSWAIKYVVSRLTSTLGSNHARIFLFVHLFSKWPRMLQVWHTSTLITIPHTRCLFSICSISFILSLITSWNIDNKLSSKIVSLMYAYLWVREFSSVTPGVTKNLYVKASDTIKTTLYLTEQVQIYALCFSGNFSIGWCNT